MERKPYVKGQNIVLTRKWGAFNLSKLHSVLIKKLVEKKRNWSEFNSLFNEIHHIYLKERVPVKTIGYDNVTLHPDEHPGEEIKDQEGQRWIMNYTPEYLDKLNRLNVLDKKSISLGKEIDFLCQLIEKKSEKLHCKKHTFVGEN